MTPTERILKAAQAVCEERGVHRLTMRRIASRAGITAPAIYRHYGGKGALLRELVADANRKMARYLECGRCAESAWQRLRLTADALLEFALEDPTSYEVLFFSRDRDDEELPPFDRQSPNFRLWLERIEDCRSEGVFKQELDSMQVAITLWSLLHGLLALHLQGRFKGSVRRLRELYLKSFEQLLAGIGTDGGVWSRT